MNIFNDHVIIAKKKSNITSSFTDFPLIKRPQETNFFFKEDPWGSPWA